jgi:polyhydroxybutyrate depolymerase
MNRHVVVFALILILTACSRPLRDRLNTPQATLQPQVPINQTGSFDEQITSSGVVRHFRLHVPEDYRSDDPLPLILNFHGYGSNSKQEEALTGMSVKADREGFIVVYPDGLDSTWYTGSGTDGQQDRQFVRDLITHLESQYAIDPQRIYATGISNGGGMTDRLACYLADLIAAVAPDSGAYNFWQDCSPSRPVPVLAFHGLDDNIVPYSGGSPGMMEPPIQDWASAWAARNGCASVPTESSLEGGVSVQNWSGCRDDADVILYTLANHGHSWPGSPIMPRAITSQAVNATDVMWEFFMSHPKP